MCLCVCVCVYLCVEMLAGGMPQIVCGHFALAARHSTMDPTAVGSILAIKILTLAKPGCGADTAAVTPSLPPSKPAAINAVFPQESEGDDVLERRPVDDVEPKCRRVGNVSAAVCPQRPPRTRRGTRGGRSKTKWPLTKLTLCPPT